jgi:hypothetical protein
MCPARRPKHTWRKRSFHEAGISVQYFDYSNYPESPRNHPPFVHAVTVLDLLFHTVSKAGEYMKTFHV